MKITVSQSNYYLDYRKQAHGPARCTVTHLSANGCALSLKNKKRRRYEDSSYNSLNNSHSSAMSWSANVIRQSKEFPFRKLLNFVLEFELNVAMR